MDNIYYVDKMGNKHKADILPNDTLKYVAFVDDMPGLVAVGNNVTELSNNLQQAGVSWEKFQDITLEYY